MYFTGALMFLRNIFVTYLIFFSYLSFSQDHILKSLTQAEFKNDNSNENKLQNESLAPYSFKNFPLFLSYCEKADRIKEMIKDLPYYKHKPYLKLINEFNIKCNINVSLSDDDQLISFTVKNETRNKINSSSNDSSRFYKFKFEERAKQTFMLEIRDDVAITGKISHDYMETNLVFIPRKIVPYIDMTKSDDNHFTIVLPTNEIVNFNLHTREIIGGVIKESPIDFNKSRFIRNFAGIKYSGKGILIRTDRRGGIPNKKHITSFNINERPNEATITYKDKICYVDKDLIWKNTLGDDGKVIFRFASDQDFLDHIINPLCQWNLRISDIL